MRIREFRYVWCAAIISNTGSWMQSLAVPFVVYAITGSRVWLGVTTFAQMIPALLSTTVAGLISDRFERRSVLLITQTIQMVTAFTMWGLWASGHASVGLIVFLIAVMGTSGGVNATVWSAYIPLLVPREQLLSAVRLNSIQFSVARALGPTIAGVVLHRFGPGPAFFINAASFLLVIAALLLVSARSSPTRAGHRPLDQFVEGWRYVLSRRGLRIPPITLFWGAMFGYAWVQLAAPLARDHFGRGADELGGLVAGYGLGSMVAAFGSGVILARMRRSTAVLVALCAWIAGLVTIAATHQFVVGIVGMVVMGFAHVQSSVAMQTSLQLQSHEAIRGRTLAIYTQGIFLGTPLGAISLAPFSEAVGLRSAVLFSAAMVFGFLVVAVVFLNRFVDIDRNEPYDLDDAGPGPP